LIDMRCGIGRFGTPGQTLRQSVRRERIASRLVPSQFDPMANEVRQRLQLVRHGAYASGKLSRICAASVPLARTSIALFFTPTAANSMKSCGTEAARRAAGERLWIRG
jgi:hypothetical protein